MRTLLKERNCVARRESRVFRLLSLIYRTDTIVLFYILDYTDDIVKGCLLAFVLVST